MIILLEWEHKNWRNEMIIGDIGTCGDVCLHLEVVKFEVCTYISIIM